MNINLIIIGVALILISMVLMIGVLLRVRLEMRKCSRGGGYIDETIQRTDRLRAKIPFYGLLMLVGVIVASLNFVFAS